MNSTYPTQINGRDSEQIEQTGAPDRIDAVMEPFRKLQQDLNTHMENEHPPQSEGARSCVLLVESERLHTCLKDLEHHSFNENDGGRDSRIPHFRDEVFRLLVGTHLRLLALANEVLLGNVVVKGEIARTHGFMRKSAMLINTISDAQDSRIVPPAPRLI